MSPSRQIELLRTYVSDRRAQLLQQVLDQRTRHLTVVLEDIYQAQNASAVLRTCECFGIQDVHIIENANPYTLNPRVVMGSSKWLTIRQYNDDVNNSKQCLSHLREQGYRVLATSVSPDAIALDEVSISEKTALVFGTELKGISDTVKQEADQLVTIPMYGFTESFNISVSAAIVLSNLSHKMRSSGIDWHLSRGEREKVELSWLKGIVRRADLILEQHP